MEALDASQAGQNSHTEYKRIRYAPLPPHRVSGYMASELSVLSSSCHIVAGRAKARQSLDTAMVTRSSNAILVA